LQAILRTKPFKGEQMSERRREEPGVGVGATGQRVGVVIRSARLRAGMSLDELARRAQCAKSTLSAIENGTRTAGDDILARVEEALGIRHGELCRLAGWERSLAAGGEEVRRELTRMKEDQRLARELVEALRSRPLDEMYRSGDLRRLVERLEGPAFRSPPPALVPLSVEVPVINKVAAGYPREFTDLSYPARVADAYVRCPDLNDPDAFAARVVGDSMAPAYAEGDIVIFSPARAVKSGMDCFARLEPDHETTFKRVYFEKEGERELIRLQPLNPAYAPRVVERERVAGLYAAVSVMRMIAS
jgi:repressor LexA